MEQHFIGKHNVIFERAQFNLRCQQEGESAETFITDVHKLAEHCSFGVLKDELIRDRIVVGIKDRKLSEQLQMDSELTLAKAIQKVRQSETVKKQQTIIHSAAGVDPKTNVDAIKTMRRGKKFQYTGKQRNQDQKFDTPSGKECGRCGKGRKHTWKDCPAKDVECRKCHKKGHFAVACRNGQAVYTVTEVLSDSDSQNYAFLGEVSTQTTKPWIEKVTLNGDAISFKLDTGADVTSIPESVFDPKRDGKLDKPLKRLVGPGKHLLDVKGCFQGKMCAKGRSTDQPVYVVAGLAQPLLGLPAIQAMRLVHRVNEVTQTDTDFKALYPSVFQGLGKLKEPYHTELEQGAVPYALSTPRRVPLPLRDKVREELERMERMGVISKVTEPTAWCSGMVVVPKPTKNKLRICVDLTPLNAAVKKERHILPAVDQTLAMMSDAKVFTKLGARSGFWQIPLTPESRPLTTFITPFGRYFFNRLPFGIASAPEHFQRRMWQMFENFEGVLCHADDVFSLPRK
ncbi:hypothetical protein H4Q32_018307 [Labeo rohita]|uniref:ribonuclease H n=1 Tax=Labeo rohita TaxID=84645 RepID=A0ABQ8LC12_LABRO|nr:hypothetical protein H4Q32_018307 [Labeo rohita]